MLKPALVIVDVQYDFLPGGALAVKDGDEIIPKIEKLLNLEKYPWLAVVITQDWHPKDHCLFALKHKVEPFTDIEFEHPLGEKNCTTGEVKKHLETVWPEHCIQDTRGAAHESRIMEKFEKVVSKIVPTAIVKKGYLPDREYYLCFTDCWKIHHTEMEDFLMENNVTDVVFVGLAYDFCVLHSACDALNSGFNTFVVRDCCKSVFAGLEEDTEKAYRASNVNIVNLQDLVHAIAS